jgi:uncharacterized protein (TIGR02145 family)
MKTLALFALVALAFTLSCCKSPTQVMNTAQPSLLEVEQLLLATNAKFLQYADTTYSNPWQAIMLTTNWVKNQPNVQSAEALDSTYINIILKSGLTTRFSFDQVNDSGQSIYRGGGQHTGGAHLSLTANHSTNTILNKKVLIYSAANADFYPNNAIQVVNNIFKTASLGLDVTLLTDEQCTPAIVDQFKDYGLVIIDTHGTPSAFMSGIVIDRDPHLTSDAAKNQSIAQKHGQYVVDGLLNGDYEMWFVQQLSTKIPNWQKHVGFAVNRVDVTTKRIDKLAAMPNTVVMGNMCYSGYQNALSTEFTPIRPAFMNKNPISYYCFTRDDGSSAPVANVFAIPMEDSLAQGFVRDFDSTKIANLKTDHLTEYVDPKMTTSNLWFRHFGHDDYSYQGCIDTFTDARDQHFYHAVCIGKQNWMAENLAYNAPGSRVYADDPSNAASYGRLYNWNILMQGAAGSSSTPSGVQGVCPKGWHIPSQAEWGELLAYSSNLPGSYGSLKSTSSMWQAPNSDANDSTHFSALPGGGYYVSFADAPKAEYSGIGQYGYFGTTTELLGNKGNPAYLTIALSYANDPIPYKGPKDANVSCRCVKDP